MSFEICMLRPGTPSFWVPAARDVATKALASEAVPPGSSGRRPRGPLRRETESTTRLSLGNHRRNCASNVSQSTTHTTNALSAAETTMHSAPQRCLVRLPRNSRLQTRSQRPNGEVVAESNCVDKCNCELYVLNTSDGRPEI